MVFTEVQRFSFLFDAGITIVIIAMIAFVWRYGNFDTPSKPKTKYDRALNRLPAGYFKYSLLIFGCLLVCLCTFTILEKQETSIDEAGIHTRLFPVQLTEHNIPWSEIQYARVSKHIPYGYYRYPSFEYVSRNGYICGIVIGLNDGRELIIGTKKPWEAASALKEFGNKR